MGHSSYAVTEFMKLNIGWRQLSECGDRKLCLETYIGGWNPSDGKDFAETSSDGGYEDQAVEFRENQRFISSTKTFSIALPMPSDLPFF